MTDGYGLSPARTRATTRRRQSARGTGARLAPRLDACGRGAGFHEGEVAVHTIPWVWAGTPEETWAATGEVRGALFRRFRAALDDDTYLRAAHEALAALRGHDDGRAVRMPAQVIRGHRARMRGGLLSLRMR